MYKMYLNNASFHFIQQYYTNTYKALNMVYILQSDQVKRPEYLYVGLWKWVVSLTTDANKLNVSWSLAYDHSSISL